MFASLPDFTPRDSHSLWYTSSRSPFHPPTALDPNNAELGSTSHGSHNVRQRSHVIERSPLARLAADENYLLRRRANVQNFGCGWLKPPGIPKTLHQIREEKREQEEHQEAMRREQLAQELADAETGGMPEDGMMDDVQLDGAQDLDDDIPDAEDEFGVGAGDDDEDDEEEQDANESTSEEEYEEAEGEERQNDLMAARLRMTDDAFREALVRGNADGDDVYGDEADLEELDQTNILEEDDFAVDNMDDGMGLDMDADLDDDIPEADSGGYEHTDSDAEITSSEADDDDDDDDDGGFAPRPVLLEPPQSPTYRSRASPTGPRSSMDLSQLLSQDDSSFINSSPAQGRRVRNG
ncbi:hypothetical protein S40285_02619 [Stachybotrys chlorohalonatus IBT 40285]|uniref:Uncharacterized protein n=1 Tax=Stachybotrys chlorohalonatus (strain IBT 40285) TaxID=1283841 RepID=A0A084QXK8_STAC4|nr:hypothetical protein S40285_02619 [Stachybotrys chlorohalonata IBT 40285]